MNDIEKIIDEIDEVIDKGTSVPLASHKLVIDGDRLKDLVYDLRENLPVEFKKSKSIVDDCDRIKKDAEYRAEEIIREAEERARIIVDEHDITKQAKQKAYDLLMQAQNKANDIRHAAEVYMDNMLTDTENYFEENLQKVKRTKQQIMNVKK